MALNTTALDLIPPNFERSHAQALEDAQKVLAASPASGLDGMIGHVMIPGMIDEDDGRPIAMKPKLDILEFWSIIAPELPHVKGLCTQVTSLMHEPFETRKSSDGTPTRPSCSSSLKHRAKVTSSTRFLRTTKACVPERCITAATVRPNRLSRLK
jgi:Mycobacterial methylenetetrahydrofolate reductase